MSRRSNAIWDILLAIEEEARRLAGSTLTTKTVSKRNIWIQDGQILPSMDSRWTLGRIGCFFPPIRPTEEVAAKVSKAGICTGDFVLQVTLTKKSFTEIPNILRCRDKIMSIVVEGRRPYCWACGDSGHMSKACPGRKTVPRPSQVAAAETTVTSGKAPDNVWREVAKKGAEKSPAPQQEASQQQGQPKERPEPEKNRHLLLQP